MVSIYNVILVILVILMIVWSVNLGTLLGCFSCSPHGDVSPQLIENVNTFVFSIC